MKTEQIIEERQSTHGDYKDVFVLAQMIKKNIRRSPNFFEFGPGREINHIALEALEMMSTKIARICSGDVNEIDHWRDIAGYAELVIDSLQSGQTNEA